MDRPVRGDKSCNNASTESCIFVLPIAFEPGTREGNVFVILVVSWWFWSSFDSISISFGKVEKNIHECVRGFQGVYNLQSFGLV